MVFEHDFEKFPELSNKQLETLEFVSPHVQIKDDFRAVVVHVHDGDTVTLKADFRDFDFPLRLLDIDAPELNAGGEEAKEWLNTRVLNREVHVEVNPRNRVGKYGRLLGKIVLGGSDVGEEMFFLGLVSEFGSKDDGKFPPFSKFMREVRYNAFV